MSDIVTYKGVSLWHLMQLEIANFVTKKKLIYFFYFFESEWKKIEEKKLKSK